MSCHPMLKSLLFLPALILFSSCASVKQTIVPNLRIVDIPPLQTERSVELGDTIVSKGKIYTYQGIDLRNQVQAGDGVFLIKFTIAPQKLMAKMEDKQWTYYVGDNVTAYDAVIGTKTVFGGLKIAKTATNQTPESAEKTVQRQPMESKPSMNTKHYSQPYAIFGNTTAVSMSPKPAPIFDFIQVNALDKPGFTQELIYNGRSGDSVKFLYRELSNSYLRAPFTQEVQYDLNQSKIIGFKGVRIEIIEATNTHLKYKVITSFPDSQ